MKAWLKRSATVLLPQWATAVHPTRYQVRALVPAFDREWCVRRATSEMVIRNRTPAACPSRFSSPAWLDRQLPPNSFILARCEEHEVELPGQVTTTVLDTVTTLVEVDEKPARGAGTALRCRFDRTHDFAIVRSREQTRRGRGPDFLRSATAGARWETRELQEWSPLTPRSENA